MVQCRRVIFMEQLTFDEIYHIHRYILTKNEIYQTDDVCPFIQDNFTLTFSKGIKNFVITCITALQNNQLIATKISYLLDSKSIHTSIQYNNKLYFITYTTIPMSTITATNCRSCLEQMSIIHKKALKMLLLEGGELSQPV